MSVTLINSSTMIWKNPQPPCATNRGMRVPQKSCRKVYIVLIRSVSSEECFHPSHNLANTGSSVCKTPLYPLDPSHIPGADTSISKPSGSSTACVLKAGMGDSSLCSKRGNHRGDSSWMRDKGLRRRSGDGRRGNEWSNRRVARCSNNSN